MNHLLESHVNESQENVLNPHNKTSLRESGQVKSVAQQCQQSPTLTLLV